MTEMRVAMYYSNSDIRLETVQIPSIGDNEVLVRIESSGICGSDIMEWYRLDKAPLVLGHEVAGVVERVGDKVSSVEIGDRVVVAHHVACNTCRYCLSGHPTVCETLRTTNFDPGGFAEYIRVPAINVDRGLFKLPDEVSFDEGTFVEPLACVFRGLMAAGFEPGKTVLVLGSGIAGLLHINLAKALGAGRVISTDINEFRRQAALKFGSDAAIDAGLDLPSEIKNITGGRLADIIIVCTGAIRAIEQSFASIDRGGTILFFAPTADGATIPLSINNTFWRTEVTLTASYAGSMKDHETALELIRAKRVEVADMITHRLSLEETGKGFMMVADGNESIKIIVKPQI